MVKIAVLVKQVPSADSRLTLNSENFNLERSLTDPVLNPADLHAVEAALRICDGTENQTILISMGPSGVEQSTKRALAMGIDEALHITDENLSGADIWVTANVLSKAVASVNADLVFAGSFSSDGENAVVPAFVAGLLKWEYVKVENEFELDQVLNLKKPTIVSVSSNLNSPRLPNFKGIAAAKNKPVTVVSLNDLNLDGIAPKVKVVSQTPKSNTKTSERKTGNAQELAKLILDQVSQWRTASGVSETQIAQSDGVKVFTFEEKDKAAKEAALAGCAIVTDVLSSGETGFVKEAFQGALEVLVEAQKPVVVTKAQAPQSNGVVVCVGGGISESDSARKLATTLDAKIVGTAAALDKGFIEASDLVGESGQSISPHVYIGFGVSGAYHHMVGVRRPNYLIAVNKDPEAEIFAKADLAIVADADEILAELARGSGN
ncbi:MAG: hypothetical protein RL228_437 [Actinomycetota bacterium]